MYIIESNGKCHYTMHYEVTKRHYMRDKHKIKLSVKLHDEV